MVFIAGETLQVYFLGTAGALPTPNKNPSCILMKRGAESLIFDCGEGAQQQMMRARTGFGVDAVFISHWHADHFLGLPGLVETMSFIGRSQPLRIYGPRWVHEFTEIIQRLGRGRIGFPLISEELSHGSVVSFDGYHVRAFGTQHGMPGLGYILEEDKRPGRFDRESAIQLGVHPGPLFGRLQRGESINIETKDGKRIEVHPEQVMGPSRPGRKIVYTGDTRPCSENWFSWGEGADLLIHDATFDDTEKSRAEEVFHSTAGEAGDVAACTGALRLALVHISSRYTSGGSHIQDAQVYFKGEVIAPEDLAIIELPFRGEYADG